MKATTKIHLKDTVICIAVAFLVKLMLLSKIEYVVTLAHRNERKELRDEYEKSLEAPCVGDHSIGSATCEGSPCYSSDGSLDCRKVLSDPASDTLVEDRDVWLDEHAPLGWSTSDTQEYTLAFVLLGGLVLKLLLLPKP